jgi:hypothetical protein
MINDSSSVTPDHPVGGRRGRLRAVDCTKGQYARASLGIMFANHKNAAGQPPLAR